MMSISDGIIIRYEENIESGTLYIFDLNREKIYKGKKLEYDVLNAIQKGTLDCYMEEIQQKKGIQNINEKIRIFLETLRKEKIIRD